MNKQSHIHKKADSSASNPVRSQLQSRSSIVQAQPQSQKPLSQTETENREFQQHNSEATKLKLQAKHGTITPEREEQLTVLQGKMSGLLQRRLEHASSNRSNFANISISRPNAPSQPVVQTKLKIGEPGSKFEKAADVAADDFIRRHYYDHPPVSQQAEQNLQPEAMSVEEKEIQTKPMLQLRSAKVGMTAAPEVEAAIQQAKVSGQTMPEKIRKPHEQHAGVDYSRVKIHTDRRADQINRFIGAEACAIGTHIFMRQGNYRPGTEKGDKLLRHELEHAKQNGAAVQRVPTVEEQDSLQSTDIVPNEARKVLLIGEGNFSFALSLAKQVQPQQAQNIVATSYDSAEQVTEKYADAANNISELRSRQVKVLHQIDATNLNLSQGPFTSIVFNFPFVQGLRSTSEVEEKTVERNQQMIQSFFVSAANFLEPGGKIFMTTKHYWLQRFTPQQLSAWAGLSLETQRQGGKVKFNAQNFPGYEHRETHQDSSASGLDTAYTLIFKKVS